MTRWGQLSIAHSPLSVHENQKRNIICYLLSSYFIAAATFAG